MVAAHQPQRMSVDEWRALLERSDVRYEYSNGYVYAMAGGTADHAQIGQNVVFELSLALHGAACRVYSADMAVRLAATEYRFPDASVTCDAADRGQVREVASPRVIVEVLSPSTEQVDRTTKARLYRACPTIQEYCFVATSAQVVEVYRRRGDVWTSETYIGGEAFDLPSIGARLVVADLYRLTEVGAADTAT